MDQSVLIKKGSDIKLNIESLAFGGMGISHIGSVVIFVKNAIPGEKVFVRVTKKRNSYFESRLLNVIDKSPYQVDALCEHFEDCGGCTFQRLDYQIQLKEKKEQVKDTFERIGQFKDIQIKPIRKCSKNFEYRNKMEFTFSNREWIPEREKNREPLNYVVGLHAPGRWDKVLNIKRCHIQSDVANAILQSVGRMVLRLKLKPYDVKLHQGFMRNLIIRKACNTDEIMVNLVTNRENKSAIMPIVDYLVEKFPNITSIVNNITSKKSGVSTGENQLILYGNDYIIEKLGNYEFMISADSFFQTNTKQAEKLYDIILEELNLLGNEIVYDLFCGTGSISIYISSYVKKVYGFEIVNSAIENAINNAKRNNVKNAKFFCADVNRFFQNNLKLTNIESPDIVIVDPPRAGLHSNTISYILKQLPKKIIYISCNIATQARDAKEICKTKYSLSSLRPIDMFPHTPHIENVATFIRDEL